MELKHEGAKAQSFLRNMLLHPRRAGGFGRRARNRLREDQTAIEWFSQLNAPRRSQFGGTLD